MTAHSASCCISMARAGTSTTAWSFVADAHGGPPSTMKATATRGFTLIEVLVR